MTVVPCGNGFGPAPLAAGCGCAAWDDGALAAGVVLDAAAADEAADVDGWLALLDDAAELCGADVEAAVGLDDDPHAVSSSASDPSPAATAHPLLRMRSPYRPRGTYVSQPPRLTMSLADSLITCHRPPTPSPVVESGFSDLKMYSGYPL